MTTDFFLINKVSAIHLIIYCMCLHVCIKLEYVVYFTVLTNPLTPDININWYVCSEVLTQHRSRTDRRYLFLHCCLQTV